MKQTPLLVPVQHDAGLAGDSIASSVTRGISNGACNYATWVSLVTYGRRYFWLSDEAESGTVILVGMVLVELTPTCMSLMLSSKTVACRPIGAKAIFEK